MLGAGMGTAAEVSQEPQDSGQGESTQGHQGQPYGLQIYGACDLTFSSKLCACRSP